MNEGENELSRETKQLSFWEKPAVRQMFVISGLMSSKFSVGIAMGTATVMLPQLKKQEDFIYVDDTMASWIYSAHGFATLPAILTFAFLSQRKGYKYMFPFVCLPIFVSFILQYFAKTAVHLLIVSICQGLTMGGNITLGLIAITEYAEPRLRGLFLVMKSASYFWGIWIANIIGTFSHWRNIPLFGLCPVAFALTSCLLWPEGPYWLASVGRIEECKRSFKWLRGIGNGSEELSRLTKRQFAKPNSLGISDMIATIRNTVGLRQFYMPLMVNCVLMTLYQASGKIVVTVFALVIIKEITKNETTAYMGMLILDGVTVICMYLGSLVAIKVGRRTIYLSTAGGTIIFLYILSAYLSLVDYELVNQNVFVSISLLVLYSFCVCLGPMVMSNSFISEISPMKFKSLIVSISSLVFWGLHSVFIKLSPVLFKKIGMNGSFGVYGTLTLICWIFLYFYLPETNKKTLDELEWIFVKDHEDKTQETENNENGVMLRDLK